MNPLVSIVVPIYKVEAFLKRCVDSILAQIYDNIEIILVDDGSPDNCRKICDAYKEKYPNIKVVHKENGGLSSARNAGMKVATGEYIFFVDSDDWIDSDCIADLVEIAEREKVDFVRTRGKYANWPNHKDGEVCDFGIEDMMVEGTYNREKIESDILPVCIATKQITFGPIVSACGNLYRTELFRQYNIWFYDDIKYSEDAIVNARVLLNTESFYYLSNRQYYSYYFNDKSITKSFRADRWKSNKIQMQHFEEDFAAYDCFDVPNQIWRKKMFLILNALSERKYIENTKDKIDYCNMICKDKDTVDAMKHLNLVKVPWKLHIVLLLIKIKQGWLLAKI